VIVGNAAWWCRISCGTGPEELREAVGDDGYMFPPDEPTASIDIGDEEKLQNHHSPDHDPNTGTDDNDDVSLPGIEHDLSEELWEFPEVPKSNDEKYIISRALLDYND